MTSNRISYKLAESGQEIVRFGDFDAVYILLPMTEVKEGHQFISTQNLYELETNKKIHLDLHFQSPERWNDAQRRLYIKSVLRGTVPTPIVLAHVESCMNFLRSSSGSICISGCLVRRSCPIGQSLRKIEQSRFHMKHFINEDN